MEQLTAIDVLQLLQKQAQIMRENGEADLRSIIWNAEYLIKCVKEGRNREIVIAEFEEDEGEDDA